MGHNDHDLFDDLLNDAEPYRGTVPSRRERMTAFAKMMGQRMFGRVPDMEAYEKDEDPPNETRGKATDLTSKPTSESDVVISLLADSEKSNLHMPVLDIDYSANLIPSGTEGHFHLYLNKPIEWEDYILLLSTMAAVGLIEQGYADASIRRGYSAARVPWKPKRGKA